jgi:hypothetical protein
MQTNGQRKRVDCNRSDGEHDACKKQKELAAIGLRFCGGFMVCDSSVYKDFFYRMKVSRYLIARMMDGCTGRFR